MSWATSTLGSGLVAARGENAIFEPRSVLVLPSGLSYARARRGKSSIPKTMKTGSPWLAAILTVATAAASAAVSAAAIEEGKGAGKIRVAKLQSVMGSSGEKICCVLEHGTVNRLID